MKLLIVSVCLPFGGKMPGSDSKRIEIFDSGFIGAIYGRGSQRPRSRHTLNRVLLMSPGCVSVYFLNELKVKRARLAADGARVAVIALEEMQSAEIFRMLVDWLHKNCDGSIRAIALPNSLSVPGELAAYAGSFDVHVLTGPALEDAHWKEIQIICTPR